MQLFLLTSIRLSVKPSLVIAKYLLVVSLMLKSYFAAARLFVATELRNKHICYLYSAITRYKRSPSLQSFLQIALIIETILPYLALMSRLTCQSRGLGLIYLLQLQVLQGVQTLPKFQNP